MGRKAYFLNFLLLFLYSCSSGSLRKSDKSNKPDIVVEESEEIPTIDVPMEDSSRELRPVKNWAVWVRGVAVDSFSGLGFMQQMESMGYSLSKVAGTGMGCWIAMSWALRNKGNYAEWQAMKFDSWDGLNPSFLDRLSGEGRKENFLKYFKKLQSSQKESLYKIPVECPLYDKSSRSLDLARDLNLEERLYEEFNLSLLEFGNFPEHPQYESGARLRSHGEAFLESLSEGFRTEKDETVWLILETSANHRLWGSESGIVKGVTKGGVRWIRFPLASELNISAQQLKDFRLRRRWLLEGRRDAKSFLHAPEIKDFLGL
ncbi:hypothetical protein GW915_08785 [bacterium]|nr:hypothetical protein [bacterium]